MKLTKTNFDSLKLLPSRPTDLLLLPSLFSTLTSSNHQQCLPSDSPDSGKGKEISSESISDPFTPNLSDQQMKTFSINDDLTTQSLSVNDNSHAPGYRSTSPSLTSSSRSSSNSIKISNKKKSKDRKTNEHHIYHQMTSNGSSSFTNSAFSQSPLRTVTKEFDPLMK